MSQQVLTRFLLIICLFYNLPLFSHDMLGESLFLESQVALYRAENWLLLQQKENGSWEDSIEKTSLAAIFLCNANYDEYYESIKKAEDFIKKSLHENNNLPDLFFALKLSFRVQGKDSLELAEKLKKKLVEASLQSLKPELGLTLFEINNLLPKSSSILSGEQITVLNKIFSANAAAVFLLKLNNIDASESFVDLYPHYTECVSKLNSKNSEEIYWLLRSIRIFENFFPFEKKSWRANITRRILSSQRGDGSFDLQNEYNKKIELKENIYTMLALQLCLAK